MCREKETETEHEYPEERSYRSISRHIKKLDWRGLDPADNAGEAYGIANCLTTTGRNSTFKSNDGRQMGKKEEVTQSSTAYSEDLLNYDIKTDEKVLYELKQRRDILK